MSPMPPVECLSTTGGWPERCVKLSPLANALLLNVILYLLKLVKLLIHLNKLSVCCLMFSVIVSLTCVLHLIWFR